MSTDEDDTRRQHILNEISDTVSRFLYYDRKEDEDLPRGAIDEAVAEGEISLDEIIERFRLELQRGGLS